MDDALVYGYLNYEYFRNITFRSENATNARGAAAAVDDGASLFPAVGADEVVRLLEESATQFTKGKRYHQAAGVRKRMAQFFEEELK